MALSQRTQQRTVTPGELARLRHVVRSKQDHATPGDSYLAFNRKICPKQVHDVSLVAEVDALNRVSSKRSKRENERRLADARASFNQDWTVHLHSCQDR